MNDKKLTPEIARKVAQQIKERMGTAPLEINVNGAGRKSEIVWDLVRELWHCKTCGMFWLRNAISRCQCEDAPLIAYHPSINF